MLYYYQNEAIQYYTNEIFWCFRIFQNFHSTVNFEILNFDKTNFEMSEFSAEWKFHFLIALVSTSLQSSLLPKEFFVETVQSSKDTKEFRCKKMKGTASNRLFFLILEEPQYSNHHVLQGVILVWGFFKCYTQILAIVASQIPFINFCGADPETYWVPLAWYRMPDAGNGCGRPSAHHRVWPM